MKNKYLAEIVNATDGKVAIPLITQVGKAYSYVDKNIVLHILDQNPEEEMWIARIKKDGLLLTCNTDM